MTGACSSSGDGTAAVAQAQAPSPPVPPAFRGLAGWSGDDHLHAFEAFRASCATGRRGPMGLELPAGWNAGCTTRESARRFFEEAFVPVRLDRGEEGLFTGYYEPEIMGSRFRHGPYQTPIHAKPRRGRGRHSRADITRGALSGQGLELFWLADPVDAFFLEIQGSGRIRLAEGGIARVGYAGQNGHRYYAIGRKLVEDGIATPAEISAEGLKAYLRANPVRAVQLMNLNPSYVFFREITDLDPAKGPIGAMGVPLTAGR
ncbi:MAG TPA: MltA domain-containing protein, partial [Thermohalobaculum sp.]|nr:MltA domain-containing protein [Thermohalobaculum sp.]